MNRASQWVEVLHCYRDEPVNVGEVGRVVVTDLFSDATPLIRYDTGDLAVLGEERDGAATMLERIDGKVVHAIMDGKGRQVSPLAVAVAMKDVEGVAQFQFVQRGIAHYVIRLMVRPHRVY